MNEKPYKIIMIGEFSVGKSCLFLRYTNNAFEENQVLPTFIEFKTKYIKIENSTVKLQIWDTAGQEKYRSITKGYYRGSHGILLVFDLSKRDTFIKTRMWLDSIKETGQSYSIILVGNKSDLNRAVSREEAEKFAAECNIRYIETSAKENINVEKAFTDLATEIYNKQKASSISYDVSKESQPSLSNDVATLNQQIKKLEAELTNKDKEFSLKTKELEAELTNKDKEFSLKTKELEAQLTNKDKEFSLKTKELEAQLKRKNKEIEEIEKKYQREIEKLKNTSFKKPQSKGIHILDEEELRNLEILQETSSGNYGKVYQVAKKIIYALKVLKNEVSQEEFKKFFAEYEIMNMLDHPNILKTFGIFLSSEEQPPSILLEFCPTNITQAIKNKTLSKTDFVFSIYQIIEGMKYVHFRNVIHRDLKPSNILIAYDGTIKIGDFGISKLMTKEEQNSMTIGIGTQKFMAPEIIDENEKYDEKVDVYSFGVLLFYMISGGELPHIKMSDKLRGKKAEIPSHFTNFARQLISDCWNFESDERPSFEKILVEMENNNYLLVSLTESEINEVKNKVKLHKEKIPDY